MNIRRGLLAQMASGHVRMASGEFTQVSGVAHLEHNLNSKKIFVVMQRVETDHSNINSTNEYQSVMIYGATVEALGLDEQQTYSLNGGTAAHFDSTNTSSNSAYPKGINARFSSGDYPNNSVMAYSDRGVSALDSAANPSNNVVRIYPVYGLTAGRWVWRAYALD